MRNQVEIAKVKKQYAAGMRVKLTKMDDVQAPPIGTCGTVLAVDDMGTIHVAWDNGSHLGIVLGEDCCRIIR